MKFYIVILVFLTLVFAGTEGLKMNLILDRDTVYVADPNFSLFLTIKNTSQSIKKVLDVSSYQKVELAKDRGDSLKVIIVSQTGETLKPTYQQWLDFPPPFPDYLIPLSPNESIVTLLYSGFSLITYYGGSLKNSIGKLYKWPIKGLSSGVYRMSVTWRDLSSNEIRLVIKNPEGKLAEAFDLYLEAWSQIKVPKINKKLSAEEKLKYVIERLSEFVFKFENKDYNLDPYAPLAFDLLYRTLLNYEVYYEALLKKPHFISSLEIFKKIVENYPNSRVAKWRIAGPSLNKKFNFQSEEEYHNYLKYIIEKYPSTLISKEADRILKNTKKSEEKIEP